MKLEIRNKLSKLLLLAILQGPLYLIATGVTPIFTNLISYKFLNFTSLLAAFVFGPTLCQLGYITLLAPTIFGIIAFLVLAKKCEFRKFERKVVISVIGILVGGVGVTVDHLALRAVTNNHLEKIALDFFIIFFEMLLFHWALGETTENGPYLS